MVEAIVHQSLMLQGLIASQMILGIVVEKVLSSHGKTFE
jgi:hypothetical protein